MITRPDLARPGGRARILRVAVALSVVVHLVVLLLALGAYDTLERLSPRHEVKHSDETVTLSTAIHFEKRPRAAQSHGSRAAVAPPPARPEPKVAAAPQVAVKRPVTPNTVKPPSGIRRELAKVAPHAPVSERQVALVQHPPAENAVRSQDPATLSAAQIARIQSDLKTSIAHDRARENPLSNVAHRVTPASTIRRYAINVAGTRSVLRGAQGLCNPQQTWNANGFVYFYVTCRTQRADGSIRNEVIPWPLRFRPSQVVYGADGPAPPPGEIPLPLPGWKLPASQYVDPDVLAFLRERRSAALAGQDPGQR